MKKSMIIACSMLFSLMLLRAPAQSTVQGPVSGYWDDDTVFVSGDIYIEDGQMLVIYHGVVVCFQGDYKLDVYGTLKTYGWLTDMVIFTTDENNSWSGIKLYENQQYPWRTNYLKYTVFEQASVLGGPELEDNYGGAIFVHQDVDLKMYRCVLKNNSALNGGGAVYLSGCNAEINGCAFLFNTSGSQGGAIFFNDGSDAVLKNCILWDNEAPEGSNVYIGDAGSDPNFTYSDIQFGKNGFAGPGSGLMYSGLYNNNISKNPICFTTASGAYNLSMCSPCIDMGEPGLIDPDGSRLDMGAVYYPHEGIYIQEPEVKGTWDINESPVWVNTDLEVPYNETLSIQAGVKVKILGHHRIDVAGSLQALGDFYDRVLFTAVVPTVGWDGINILPESAYSEPSELSFCTIEYGVARGDGDFEDAGGGLLVNGNSNVTIEYCNIMNCKSLIERDELSGGGGIAIMNCSPILRKNKIMNNEAVHAGGGLLLVNARPQILYNLIVDNTCGTMGAGIMLTDHSYPVLINNTICFNSAESEGGGLYCTNSSPVVINSILYFNEAEMGKQLFLADDTSDPSFMYCDIQGGKKAFEGDGALNLTGYYLNNISINPALRSASEFYLLEYYSPCINTGHPNLQPDPDGTRADMGYMYYEFYYSYDDLRSLAADEESEEPVTEIRMYPNPAIDMVNCDLKLADPGIVTVEVYNSLGQLVRKVSDNQMSSGSYHTTLNVSDFQPGVYMVKLTAKNMMHTKMLVVK